MDRRERLIARARQGYRLAFGVEPTRFVAAPGRVNLIGEHVDYNEGFVLPCAIDRETVIAFGPGAKDAKVPRLEAVALDMGDMASARDGFDLAGLIHRGDNNWQNHVRGVIQALGRYGHRIRPMRMAIAGDVPIGAGLSSSAAFGVAVALAASEYSGLGLAPEKIAKMAQIAENDFVGCACGIMDQMASAASVAGHALLLDCRSLEHMPIPIHRRLAITVIDTGLRRSLTESAFNERRAECEAAAAHFGLTALRDLELGRLEAAHAALGPVLYRRARHVVSEMGRVEPVAVALATGDTAALAALMREAHLSLSADFDVSLPPIDRLAALVAEALGEAGGVRLTGAGFGGCLVAVTHKDATGAIDDAIARYNADADLPARAEIFRPSDGAAPIVLG
ncbi:galactokinase [Porphyrobacter sp. CACIAM 03H1]|uniref:galactokinase n=1 Tax=Porphyrobacter sp. CACIAM 03H1 TaxID=2003315 RepID=UPI000B5A37DC|nr:galactokinase [Porphyrobacter sp. CACIAM 03H1]ASJ90328.1 galactokinase [Porphyrobacter sp. CACIAM 03H1]